MIIDERRFVVAVTGGRDFNHIDFIYKTMNEVNIKYDVYEYVFGDAHGVDAHVQKWVIENKLNHKKYYADWGFHGKSAGPIRNKQILDECRPNLLIAFPGGRGTANMVIQARRRGVPIMICLQ